MKWTPRNWNDTFSLVILIVYVGVIVALIAMGVEQSVLTLVIGAFLAQLGQIVTHYYRKAPPPGGMEGGD